MKALGVPYEKTDAQALISDAEAQAALIGTELAEQGVADAQDKEIVALIAYLQRLGVDINRPASN